MLLLRCGVVLLAIVASACNTPYQESGFTGGVVASPITADTYRISARGNGFTDQATIQDYVLLRAAETTLYAGATHFVVLGSQDATRFQRGQTPGTINSNLIGNSIYTTYTPGYQYDIVKPGQDTMIQLMSIPVGEPAPAGAWNATEIYQAINPRVRRPEA